MRRKNDFNLIKGFFTPEQAKVILLELYDHKIGFHEKEKFSYMERYGKDALNSELRITELKVERGDLNQLLVNAEKAVSEVFVECVIRIR